MIENTVIRKLMLDEQPPMELLLLADPSETLVKKYLNKGSCFIYLIDNTVVGEYLIMPTSESVIELMNVAVLEEYQGLGIGKQLVLNAITQARKLGFTSIEVGTADIGAMQIRLYRKCGFTEKEMWHDFFIKNYDEPMYHNGMQLKHMIRLSIKL